MSPLPAITVDLGAVARNWAALDAASAGRAGAVVKADAYGLGAVPVTAALHAAGCRDFFVAYPFEGAAIRPAAPAARIFVLNGIWPEDEALLLSERLIPVVSTLREQSLIAGLARADSFQGYALKVETGMNRLGLCPELAEQWLEAPGIPAPLLLMSHLACSDADVEANELQLSRFSACISGINARSLANSDAIRLGARFTQDISRPGIALFGAGRTARELGLDPAGELSAAVVSSHRAAAGETVGYGGTFRAARDTALATVALGYADGLPRAASGVLSALSPSDGALLPLAGRVSMDLATLDVSALDRQVRPGERMVFFGPLLPIDSQAAKLSTIAYELLTGLGPRVRRIYR